MPESIFVRQFDPSTKKKTWQRVASSEEISKDTPVQRTTSGRDVLLVRTDGHLCAVDAECPHRGASLANGKIVDGNIRCPLHGYEFDLRTGQGVGNDLFLETLKVVKSEQPPE